MKKIILSTVLITTVLVAINLNSSNKEDFADFINQHPYMNRDFKEVSETKKQDRPDLGWELNYILTMDPNTKKPEPASLLEIYQEIKGQKKARQSTPGQSATPWVERGPTNVGGRTRAVIYDPTTDNKVWAGSVGGGLWFNNDITDANSSWQSVDDFWDNLSITSIAFDPNNNATMYVGTGEGWGAGAARGAGVWKSTDSGVTWNQLSATSTYYYVNDLVVRNESDGVSAGILYVGTAQNYHRSVWHGNNGIRFSTDGGSTFTTNTSFAPTKLCIASDGRIWSGTNDGKIMYSDNGTDWTVSHSSGMGRVAIACAASDANYIYGLFEDGGKVGKIIYSDDKGVTWTTVNEPADVDSGIPDTDFTRGQAWYDLTIAVDPNDENTIVVGGIDLFISTNNGTSWGQISRWHGEISGSSSVVHADQHIITFKGAGSNEVLFGNDGGVFYSSDLVNSTSSSAINVRNKNYNVTQFYSCAIHPEMNKDFFLAGAQDNGTQRFTTSGLNETIDVFGGDGSFCFIDQTDATFQIVSYVYNVYGLSTNEGTSFDVTLQDDQESGLFINPADYDDNLDILYSSKSASSINRISNITTSPSVESLSVSLGNLTSHLRVSPYTTASTTLYGGTLSGKVFKIENANTNSPNTTEITGGSFPSGSVSCIELGVSEDELLVTFSNYGVTSVWYSSNGGSTWSNKEGDLPNMPVRWALFNPNNRNEVLLATELGVWKTSNLSDSSPTWASSSSGLANVRTDMLQLRSSDNEVIATTHGRGLFSSNGFQAETAPNVNFKADVTFGCASSLTVNFTDLSSANPAATSYDWTFEGGTPSSSQNQTPPSITYNSEGTYDVTLKVTNTVGESSKTKSDFISLGSSVSLPFSESFESETFPPACWAVARGSNGLGTVKDWIRATDRVKSGTASAHVEYEDVVGGNAEDWLITPPIDLAKSENNQLSFYSRERYADDYGTIYSVKVSTTSQTDLSSFTVLATYDESQIPDSFGELIVDLSTYDGNTVYIAFVMEQDDGDDWYIDDVSVTGTLLEINISADNGLEICSNESTTLSVPDKSASGSTYQWKLNNTNINEAISASYTPTETGSYLVIESTGTINITSDAVIVTIHELPSITTQPNDQIICDSESVSFSIVASGDNLSYQWFLDNNELADGSDFDGVNSSTLIVTSESNIGEYSCKISSSIDCSVVSELATLTICTATSIQDDLKNQFSLYPNPASNYLTIEFDELNTNNKLSYSIYDLSGQIIDSRKIDIQGNKLLKHSVDLTGYRQGVYVIRIKLGNKVFQRQVIIK